MTERIIIFSRRCFIDNRLLPATITLENGKITDIRVGQNDSAGADFDFGNSVIMPGCIDAHVHINEPGRTEWEGFETATKAAAKGGTTTLVDMPLNSSPVVTSPAAFRRKLDAAAGKLHVNCGFWAGATNDDFQTLQQTLEAGCLGVKVFLVHSGIDEFPNISEEDLDGLMKFLGGKNIPILAHCEWTPRLIPLRGTTKSYQSYMDSRPNISEDYGVDVFIQGCKKYNTQAHVVHLASANSLEHIRQIKSQGHPLTVETCPHYILFSSEQIEDGDTLYKCAPPIRSRNNNRYLIKALVDGEIDFIATDHSPAPPDVKGLETGDFNAAWGGIAGLQFLLSASWTALKDEMDLLSFIPLVTSGPAEFIGLKNSKGKLQIGFDADITIWNPASSFKVREQDIEHRHKISPYVGKQLSGEVVATFVNGRLVYHDRKFIHLQQGKTILKTEHGF